MTIGDRIKYCRKRIHITQNELAEATGIHPVTIRKYETNKIVPQPEQIRRLSHALCVGYNALAGLESANLDLITQGDFIGFLMQLKQKGLISFEGNRNPISKQIESDSFRIILDPIIAHLITISIKSEPNFKEIPGDSVEISLSDHICSALTTWDMALYVYNETSDLYNETRDDSIKSRLDDIAENLAKIEIQAQTNTYLLDESPNNPYITQWEIETEKIQENLSKESAFTRIIKEHFFNS